jgi:hypothetical protein
VLTKCRQPVYVAGTAMNLDVICGRAQAGVPVTEEEATT